MCYQSSNGRGGDLHTQAKFSLCSILGQRLTLHETIYRNKKTELVLIIHGILRHRYSQNKNAPALIHCAVVLVTWWRAGPARGAVDVVPWCRGALCAGTPECGPARYVRLRPIYWHQGGPRTQRPLHQRNRVDLQRRQRV